MIDGRVGELVESVAVLKERVDKLEELVKNILEHREDEEVKEVDL